MKSVIIIAIVVVCSLGVGVSFSVSAEEGIIPSWIKNTALWWGQGNISDTEFLSAIEFLSNQGLIRIESPSSDLQNNCLGNAGCIPGKVTQVIDGDTIKVYGKSIRFALSSAPELDESGGQEAKKFIENICPVDSTVLVDEDDLQTQGSYGRIIGIIYCNGVNLNEELVDSGLGYITPGYCAESEFSNELWVQKHGCLSSFDSKSEKSITDSQTTQNNCDSSYPDRFDADRDGIGCESG
jgi:endonuclease YncB( thermonuclease family)